MRVAILGTRGIPACYGGFETFAEEISTRLVQRGHAVTVYGRHPFFRRPKLESPYRGVTLRSSPTIMHKYLETPLHALTSFLDLWTQQFDTVLLCNAANSPFGWLVRLRGLPLYINVDGIERRRSKWNSLGRLWYKLGERASVCFATKVVSDAEVIAAYYRERFGCDSAVIAYGAEPKPLPPGETLRAFNLSSGQYLLYVSRLEPENNALGVIKAYKQSGVTVPLVVVGDAPYAEDYKRQLREAAMPGVIFTGFQFREAYRELRSNCLLYVQATEVGGTHPALVEAMAYGNCVVANDTPEHREVLGDAGEYYAFNDFDDLARRLKTLVASPELLKRYSSAASERAKNKYSWDVITDQYERLLSGAT
ncbi:MAG: glycosyltransferase [Deltaproteobacteria bacterium]|nr:glycosyltransferase [Deltaproteobacteria bacterium]